MNNTDKVKGHIRLAVKEDLESVKKLCDENISRDFYSEQELSDMIDDKDKYLYIYNEDDSPFYAYFYFMVTNFYDAVRILNIPENSKTAASFKPELRVGILKSASTDVNLRKKGVFSQMLHFALESLEQMGVDMIIGNAAISPTGKIYTGSMLLTEGFTDFERLEHPWIGIESFCPVCRKLYCECNSAVFIKVNTP